MPMLVPEWGNSLAVRLPWPPSKLYDPKEGDDVEIDVVGRRAFDRDRSRARALEGVRAFPRPLPPGRRFDRDDASRR